jgi:hypothetical protein
VGTTLTFLVLGAIDPVSMVDVKPQLPLFDGRNVRAYLAQFSVVVAYLIAVDATWNNEARIILLLAAHLTGAAATWLVAQQNANGGVLPWATLDDFKQALITRFAPVEGNLMSRRQLSRLKQTGPVRRYNDRFTALLNDITDVDANEARWRYLEGLKPLVAAQVQCHHPATLHRAMELAQAFDEITFRTSTSTAVPMELGAIEARTCFICKSPGHLWRRCPNKRDHPCAKCNKVGHPASLCRSAAAARKGRSA